MHSSPYRYGFYARPDFDFSRAQAEVHDLLRRQYGLISGGLFMPHATVKGFFVSDAQPAQMIERLDAALDGWEAFTAYNNGVILMGATGLVVSVRDLLDGSPNPAWHALQDRAWAALEPIIAPDCDFTPGDGHGRTGDNAFHAHFTLAMADPPRRMLSELKAFVAPGGRLVGPPTIRIEALHLYRFSADWQGNWPQTIRWELLNSWWRP